MSCEEWEESVDKGTITYDAVERVWFLANKYKHLTNKEVFELYRDYHGRHIVYNNIPVESVIELQNELLRRLDVGGQVIE